MEESFLDKQVIMHLSTCCPVQPNTMSDTSQIIFFVNTNILDQIMQKNDSNSDELQ